jgi:hypothetical protein
MVKVSIQNSLSILLQRAQSERAQCRRHAHSACTRPLCRDCACHDCGEVPLANLSFLLSFNLPRLFLSGHRLYFISLCLLSLSHSFCLPADRNRPPTMGSVDPEPLRGKNRRPCVACGAQPPHGMMMDCSSLSTSFFSISLSPRGPFPPSRCSSRHQRGVYQLTTRTPDHPSCVYTHSKSLHLSLAKISMLTAADVLAVAYFFPPPHATTDKPALARLHTDYK